MELWEDAQALSQKAKDAFVVAIRAVLEESAWLQLRAAKKLGVSYSTMRGYIERAGLHWEVLQRRHATGNAGGRPREEKR